MIISLDRASLRYGPILGLSPTSFELPDGGGITGLLGPNGAGKSSLLQLLSGLLPPSGGEVRVFGEAPFRNAAVLSRLGLVPEGDRLPTGLRGDRWLRMMGELSGLSGEGLAAAVARSLATVGMTERAHLTFTRMSKGMRQRIRLAQSISHDPQVLVLDEPLNGLDPLVRAETIALFKDKAATGSHVIISSHVLHEVDLISDQVILMTGGYVVAEGQIKGVRNEIADHPMQILIRCKRPSELAARMFDEASVVEAKVHSDGGGLLIKTTTPDRFYLMLNQIALNDVGIETVAPVDDDVNSVYEYLINEGEVVR